MEKRVLANALLALFFLVAAGCATLGAAGHKYIMKGQILDVSSREAYLCIGSSEGAKAGQEFNVYRFKRVPPAVEGPQQRMSYRRERVGAIKITEVVHEHYAKAVILNGDVREHDVAELNR